MFSNIPDIQKLLVNLKIISKIQKHGRLAKSRQGYLQLEEEQYFQCVRRMWNNDNRYANLKELDLVVSEAINKVNAFMDLIGNPHGSLQTMEVLCNELQLASVGIENLKTTYAADAYMVSELDIIILRIDKTTNSALKVFNQYTTNMVDLQQHHENVVKFVGITE